MVDSDAAMNVNGVPRKEFGLKLGVALFASAFPLLGAALAFTPRPKLERALVRLVRMAKDFVRRRIE